MLVIFMQFYFQTEIRKFSKAINKFNDYLTSKLNTKHGSMSDDNLWVGYVNEKRVNCRIKLFNLVATRIIIVKNCNCKVAVKVM